MISRISLATDFSEEGAPAFRAALSLAVICSARLDILHVSDSGTRTEWRNFPHVRETLEAWQLLTPGSRQEDVQSLLGVAISKVDIHGGAPALGIADFVAKHTPDILVAASHGRTGRSWWHDGSVAMEAMRRAAVPALLFGPSSREAVDPQGALRLQTALMPVAETPNHRGSLMKIHELLDRLAPDVRVMHVETARSSAASVRSLYPQAVCVTGEVVPSILEASEKLQVDFIAMPTARNKGLIGALLGSTTEKVLHAATCPVLALPG
jgi:nucleotide-binding universal stress UspA family protein